MVINIQKSKAAQRPRPVVAADVAMAAVAAPPVATPEIEMRWEDSRAKFDPDWQADSKFDPQTGKQNGERAREYTPHTTLSPLTSPL